MSRRAPGLLLGISALWIPLAFLFDGVTVLVLPLRLGGDAAGPGLVSLVGLALAAAFQPLAGRLGDRLRPRLGRRSFLLAAALPALAGLWLLVGSAGVAAALAGYVLLQLAASALQAGQQTLIPEHVPAARRGRAAGLKAAFDVGGAFLAFLVLGALLAGGDLLPAAAAITAAVAIGLVLVLWLVPERLPAEPGAHPAAAPGRLPNPLGVPPGFARLVAARFLFLFGTYAVGRFLLLLVAARLGLPADRAADEAGGLLALLALVTALAALPAGRLADRFSPRALMGTGAALAGAGILLLVPAAGMPGLLAGGLLMSLGTAAFVPANWAATTRLVAPADAGRLMGIANLGTGLAAAAAGILGPLIDTAGFAPALLVAALASLAAVLPLSAASLPRPVPEASA